MIEGIVLPGIIGVSIFLAVGISVVARRVLLKRHKEESDKEYLERRMRRFDLIDYDD